MKKFLLILSVFLLVGCSNNNKVSYKDELTLLGKYTHDTDSFTQGLFFHDGKLYESIGQYGKSKLLKDVSLEDGFCKKEYEFDNSIFAEGSTIFKNKIYVLSWKEKKAFVFNTDTLEIERENHYDREGWGLTTDGYHLIASDGTNNLYYYDENFNLIKTINIDGVYYLNELEYINGYIWANIYMSDRIAVIDPKKESVVKIIDFEGLYKKPKDVNKVLNGIAFYDDKVFITGKNWDTMYAFKIKD